MRRLTQSLALCTIALAVALLAAGCGTGAGSSIKSLVPTKSISVPSLSPGGASPAPTPTAQSPAASATGQPTVAGTTAAPTPTAQPASSPAVSTGSSLLWLWILIGVVVVVVGVVVLVLVARYAGRRSVVAGGWLARAVDAYAQGSALHDAMMVAERPGTLAAADSGARWADIQRRADDFAQVLYALREAAAEADDRVRVTDVLGTLGAVRSAMDAQRAPGGATADQAEVVRARLFAFRDALGELRPSDRRVG